jgi:hypothetical protein
MRLESLKKKIIFNYSGIILLLYRSFPNIIMKRESAYCTWNINNEKRMSSGMVN